MPSYHFSNRHARSTNRVPLIDADSSHNANARVFYSIGKILSDLSFADLFIDGSQIKDIARIRYVVSFESRFSLHFISRLEKLKSIEFC